MPEKRDLKKEWKSLYSAPRDPVVVEVPPFSFLMIDGEGPPGSPAFGSAVEALFSVAYAVKFACKKDGADFGVMPLEGLWWADDLRAFERGDRERWKWTLMIHQPSDLVTHERVESAIAAVERKKGPRSSDDVRFELLHEGAAGQVLHVGPFSDEGPTVARLHAFLATRGKLAGKHHEIYLSDFRRGDPAKWRTIVRQPFR